MTLIQAFYNAAIGDELASPTLSPGMTVKKVSDTELTFTEGDGLTFTATVGSIVGGTARALTLDEKLIGIASKDDWDGSATDPVITSFSTEIGAYPMPILPLPDHTFYLLGRNLNKSPCSVIMKAYESEESEVPFDTNDITEDIIRREDTNIEFSGIEYRGSGIFQEWYLKKGMIDVIQAGEKTASINVIWYVDPT